MTAFCETCDAWRSTLHSCYPVYEARDATDDGVGIQPDDPWDLQSKVRAPDAEAAAEKFAQHYDEGGDDYLSRSESNEILVEVRPVNNRSKVQRFKCWASHSVAYYSEEVPTPEALPAVSDLVEPQ